MRVPIGRAEHCETLGECELGIGEGPQLWLLLVILFLAGEQLVCQGNSIHWSPRDIKSIAFSFLDEHIMHSPELLEKDGRVFFRLGALLTRRTEVLD